MTFVSRVIIYKKGEESVFITTLAEISFVKTVQISQVSSKYWETLFTISMKFVHEIQVLDCKSTKDKKWRLVYSTELFTIFFSQN